MGQVKGEMPDPRDSKKIGIMHSSRLGENQPTEEVLGSGENKRLAWLREEEGEEGW